MARTAIGFLKLGELFSLEGRIYKVGHCCRNTCGYVACTDMKTSKVTRFYIDTTVDDMREADNE